MQQSCVWRSEIGELCQRVRCPLDFAHTMVYGLGDLRSCERKSQKKVLPRHAAASSPASGSGVIPSHLTHSAVIPRLGLGIRELLSATEMSTIRTGTTSTTYHRMMGTHGR